MSVLLGAIADDFTGATDLCNTLVRRGMRTVQLIDVPAADMKLPDAEAVVIALKSRTIPAEAAVAMSLAALGALRRVGARQIIFKYCSTFDSTDAGNIGPVAEALLDTLGADFTLFCPAFPENGRTIFKGYLFVGDLLLSESGMRDHPLTPMRDPSLVRVLQRQSKGKVGLVPHAIVAEGAAAIRTAFGGLRQNGFRHAIVDALADRDLEAISEAAADLALITGGSGIALGLPGNFRRHGLLGEGGGADALPAIAGAAAVLSGSCSEATRAQVAHMRERAELFTIDPIAAAEGRDIAEAALAWAAPRLGHQPVLISATASPEAVTAAQQRLGRERATGGGNGIGAACARGFAAAGARVAVIDRDGAAAERVAAEIGGTAKGHALDVADGPAFARLAADFAARDGGIDVLVNSAGTITRQTIAVMPAADWDRVIAVNLRGPFNGTQAVIPHMKKRGGGAVVNVASVAGRRISFGGGANYSASKAGLLGFTRHAAYELAPDKIRVNAVCPGPTATAFGGGQVPSAERKAERAKKIPLGRMVEPEDIADAVLFLASDLARMCTGVALDVDGGVLISNDIPYEEYFARAR